MVKEKIKGKMFENFVRIYQNLDNFDIFSKNSSVYIFTEIPYSRCLYDTCEQKDRCLDVHDVVNGRFSRLLELT